MPLFLSLIDCSGDLSLFLSETDRSVLVSPCPSLNDRSDNRSCDNCILIYFWVFPGLAVLPQEWLPRHGVG